MLERETEIIIQILIERALGSSKSLTLREALTGQLPKSIKLYLQGEVNRWLREELRSGAHFSHIRFSALPAMQLARTFTRSIASEYIFTREEFINTLDNAVHFVENYLCRPQWTLEQFVFDKEQQRHVRRTPDQVRISR